MTEYKTQYIVDGKIYPAIFNLNVMEQIQEQYGTMAKWAELTDAKDGEPNVKALKFGICAMLNEAIEIENEEKGENRPLLTLSQVGRMISRAGVEKSAQALNDAVISATKTDEPKNA